MTKYFLLLIMLVLPTFAWAADSTLAVTAGSGTTIVVSPDGGGNVVPHTIFCDHTTPTQCDAVNSSGQVAIQAPPSLPLPTGAATAANQTNVQGTAGSPGSTVSTVQGISGATPIPVNLAAATSGGCTPYHLSGGTTASNNANNIKSSAGNLCSLMVFNDGTGSSTAVNYIKLYNLSSSPTCSSATGLVHILPISVSATVGGFIWSVTLNESYSAGIGFCVVSTGADTGNGNASTGIYVEASYK